jgi:hypothetical protein
LDYIGSKRKMVTPAGAPAFYRVVNDVKRKLSGEELGAAAQGRLNAHGSGALILFVRKEGNARKQ